MARPRKQDGTNIKGGVLRSKRGTSPLFDLTIPDLESELKRLLDQIPAGRVTTYGQLADALGLRAAARWVGEYLRDHEHPSECPCHRVVRKEGALGLYLRGRDPEEKAQALRREGIGVRDGLVERFPEVDFSEFQDGAATRPADRAATCLRRTRPSGTVRRHTTTDGRAGCLLQAEWRRGWGLCCR